MFLTLLFQANNAIKRSFLIKTALYKLQCTSAWTSADAVPMPRGGAGSYQLSLCTRMQAHQIFRQRNFHVALILCWDYKNTLCTKHENAMLLIHHHDRSIVYHLGLYYNLKKKKIEERYNFTNTLFILTQKHLQLCKC